MKKANIYGTEFSKLYLRGTADFPIAEITETGIVYYVYGSNGMIAKIENNNTSFMVKDHLGSTRLVLDSEDNSVVSNYKYDAYGSLMQGTERGADVNYQYTGQEYEDELDLHNFRARFYDSDLMRFYAVDPAEEFASPYLYCGNNPIIFVDLDGEDSETISKFCDEFTIKYDLETDYSTLSNKENECFAELSDITARFSDIQEDLKIPKLYYNEAQIRKKIEQIMKELRIEV